MAGGFRLLPELNPDPVIDVTVCRTDVDDGSGFNPSRRHQSCKSMRCSVNRTLYTQLGHALCKSLAKINSDASVAACYDLSIHLTPRKKASSITLIKQRPTGKLLQTETHPYAFSKVFSFDWGARYFCLKARASLRGRSEAEVSFHLERGGFPRGALPTRGHTLLRDATPVCKSIW